MLFKDHFQKQLNDKIKKCTNCKFKSNPGPVLGYGGLNAEVMFISDAPKQAEIASGVPFTGIAKDRMVKAISDTDLKRGEYYFTYFIKHSLANDRPDTLLKNPCMDILIKEIELINPKIICSMGFYVTQALIKEYKLEEINGGLKVFHGNGLIIPVKTKRGRVIRPKRYLIPTWSPAVDNYAMNIQFEKDILTIKHVYNLKSLLFDS